jgi:hypothetical protein
MTQRENCLSLMGRRGYEFAPVFFFLCPHQVEEYKKKTGVEESGHSRFKRRAVVYAHTYP